MSKTQKNEFNISGKVVHVFPVKEFSEKFKKSSLILAVWRKNQRIADQVEIEFANEYSAHTESVHEEDWVNIDFMIGGRAWTPEGGKTKWFTSIQGISCTIE